MRKTAYLPVACLALLVAGCANNKQTEQEIEPVEPVEPVAAQPPVQIERKVGISWDNIGRAGAAVHQPAFVHTVGGEVIHAVPASGEASSTRDGSDKKTAAATATTGLSFYELQRWERYCDSGKGMDEHDWRFVSQNDYKHPAQALPNCNKPAHDYPQYLDSWTKFCTSNPDYSSADIAVVKNSVRPFSRVNPCKALSAGQGGS